MKENSNVLSQRVALILLAFSILPWAAFGFAGLLCTGKQLFTGYDDFPLGAMLGGISLGAGIGLGLFVYICVCASKNAFRPAWITIGSAAAFGVLWIPTSRGIMYVVELEAKHIESTKKTVSPGQARVFQLSPQPDEITTTSP